MIKKGKKLPTLISSILIGMSVPAYGENALQELENYVIDNAQAIVDVGEDRAALQNEYKLDIQQLLEEKQQLKATVDQLVIRLDQLTQALEQSTASTKAYANAKASQAEQAAKATANDARTRAINAQSTANDAINRANKAANTWPPSSYCIFANGACPSGFTRHEGYLRAISLYDGSSSYIKQSTFGSSKISCHGGCGQYGHWTGELHLQICCK